MRKEYRIKAIHSVRVSVAIVCLALMPVLNVSAIDILDSDITDAINTELISDNAVTANNIDVSTGRGVVALTGTVNNILAKERATEIAEAIVGVRSIVNTIIVKPSVPRSDKDISKAVEDAWANDPATDSYELKAVADDGIVTITGTVDSYAEKELGASVAKGVKGVKGIKSEVKVDYKTKRSDKEIEGEVMARLENDVRVDDLLVEVKVDDGEVKLSGTVGSLQEKNRTYTDAWVAGVGSVDTSDLDIKWWARDSMRRKSAYISRTDDEIKKAVEDAFLYDPRVYSFQPSVSVFNGKVTLTGEVDNLKAKRAAEQDARNTLGVWRVKNHLKVRTEVPENDDLVRVVASALLADPYIEWYEVDAKAYDGWVHLSGDVQTSFEKNHAETVVEGVKGVVGVVNNINYEQQWVRKPDWEIRADVKEQLESSPFVNQDNISISVGKGIVTLTGGVGSWSEKGEAENNAYQAGAKDVLNELTVDYRYYGPYGPGHDVSYQKR